MTCPAEVSSGTAAAPSENGAPEWWDRTIFFTHEGGQLSVCPKVIDVTGPVRFLVHGPYRPLEPGLWRATVYLKLCPDAARRMITVQFGADPDYATVDLGPTTPGAHTVELLHPFTTPSRAQVRILLRRAGFHGEVRFFGAWIERVGDDLTSDNARGSEGVAPSL